MTRIYASIVILALVAALTFTGNYAVKTHIHTFSNALSDISAAAQEKDFTKTKAQAVTLIENLPAYLESIGGMVSEIAATMSTI